MSKEEEEWRERGEREREREGGGEGERERGGGGLLSPRVQLAEVFMSVIMLLLVILHVHSGRQAEVCSLLQRLIWVSELSLNSHQNGAGLILRSPDQNGVSQAWYVVEIHHSGRKPSISHSTRWTVACGR